MRGWMNEGKSYIALVEIGEMMRAGGLGHVTASKNPKFAIGDCIYGAFGVQEFGISNGNWHYEDKCGRDSSARLSRDAWNARDDHLFWLTGYRSAKARRAVVVSGAAGAVGTVVGQIAKIKGCTVVGIAGGAEKCNYIAKELGFDSAIDYKSEDVHKSLRKHCPNGVDVYFDNVVGDILDAALTQLARGARVVICGAVSQYGNTTPNDIKQTTAINPERVVAHPDIAKVKVSVVVGLNCFDKRPVIPRGARPTIFV